MGEWYVDLQRNLGIKPTPQNNQFLQNWQRWEGGHTKNSARYNWLNTTMDAPGAVSSINSVGVKSFRSRREGLNALALTLLNGRYGDIVEALRSGDPYSSDVSRGLQVWVSGRPDGNPEYAQKVLGRAGVPKAAQPRGGRGTKGNLLLAPALPGTDDVWRDIFKDDPKFLRILNMFGPRDSGTPAPQGTAGPRTGNGGQGTTHRGKTLVLPTKWKSTHSTDGLESEGFRSAVDIMGKAGTPVGAPEAGTIVRHGSAQGGESLWFQSDSGRMYWIGHIDNLLKPGTRVKRGQVIASISADHPRPHVHLDSKVIK